MGFFNRIEELQRRLETVPDIVAECVEYNQDQILQLRKDELLLGRNSDGEPFTPEYTEDPYFKNSRAAHAYANYKYKIEAIHSARIEHPLRYPNKDSNTPNLRLTRDKYNSRSFHDQMFIVVGRDSFEIGSRFEGTADINAKYNNKVFDLGTGAKEWFYENILLPRLKQHLKGQ